MNTLILPVTDKAMETLRAFGATLVPGQPGFAEVPTGAMDLQFEPLGAVTKPVTISVMPPK